MAPAPVQSVDNPRVNSEPTKQQPSTTKTSLPKVQMSHKVKATLPLPKPAMKFTQQNNMPRRSSKPIINWFQRKLTGHGKTKRTPNTDSVTELGRGNVRGATIPLRTGNRITSSPLPIPVSNPGRHQGRLDSFAAAKRKTISLNGDDEARDFSLRDDNTSLDRSSFARESTYSPASALEADDDASVRPLPPSTPPSPSPSRSSSSYLSDPRTFRSMAASTKPTTLLSVDLNGNGMAHIAQAPMTAPLINRFPPHVRASSPTTNPALSGTSITFSVLPASAQPLSRAPSLLGPGSISNSQQVHALSNGAVTSVQAPLHTTHHPRNNPRPSSPPLDNASILTLASSAYAIPGMRTSGGMAGYNSAPPSATAIGDSVSHFGGSIIFADVESTSQFVLGDDDRLEERDMNASVRALRPRSSRRGSWESEASRWSARVQCVGAPSLARERSLWTTNSLRTGGLSAENPETYERSDEPGNEEDDSKEELTQFEAPASQSSLPDPLDLGASYVESSLPDPRDLDASYVESSFTVSDSEPTPKSGFGINVLDENVSPPIPERTLSTDTLAQLAVDKNAAISQAGLEPSTKSTPEMSEVHTQETKDVSSETSKIDNHLVNSQTHHLNGSSPIQN